MRTIGLGCLGLLLVSCLGLWAARDLPRRTVAGVLADTLGAQVRVDQLEFLGADRFSLDGLAITGLSITGFRDYPFVDAFKVERLVVEGPLLAMLDNRFDRLSFRGVDLRLAPAPPAPETPDRPLPRIGELIIEPAQVRIAGGSARDDAILCVEAVVRDVGAQMHGEAKLSTAVLDFRSLSALGGWPAPPLAAWVRDLDLELTFDPNNGELHGGASLARLRHIDTNAQMADGDVLVELTQPRFNADHAGSVGQVQFTGTQATTTFGQQLTTIANPSAEATLTATTDDMLHVVLKPRLAWLTEGSLEADWDPTRERLLRLEAQVHGLDLQRLLPGAGLEATVDAAMRGTGERLDYHIDLALDGVSIANDRELTGIAGSMIRVTGSLPGSPLADFRPPAWDGPVTATLEIPTGQGRWGSMALPPEAFPLAASFSGRWLGGEALPRGVTGGYQLDSPAGRLTADGDMTMESDGTTESNDANVDLRWAWTDIDLERLGQLLPRFGLPAPTFELKGKGKASGHVRGPIEAGALKTLDLRGELHLKQLAAGQETEAGVVRLSDGEATANLTWAGGQAPIEISRMVASGTVTSPWMEPLTLDLQTAGELGSGLTRGRLTTTIRESAGLGTAHLIAGWHQSPAGSLEVSGTLNLEALDVARWQTAAKPLAEAAALADFQLAGSAGADLAGSLTAGTWHVSGPAYLESAGFTSLDGSRVAEGLECRLDLDLRGAPSAPIEVEGSGRLGGFLLLWNTFFGDFSEVEATLGGRVRIEPEDGALQGWRLELDSALPGGPRAAATLEDRGDGWRYTLGLDDPDLAATHTRYLAPLLEEYLGQLELGGKLAVRVRGDAAAATLDGWSLIGDVQLRDLQVVSGGGQATVAGLDLDLPLDLRRSLSPASTGEMLELSGPRLTGRLAFERLAVRGLELPPTQSDLSVEADSVGLEKPVVLSVLGGDVTLERLTLRELLRPSRHLESGIELADIQLEKISDELELLPLEGALNGRLAGVRLSPSLLSVDGGGKIEVFGGTVEVRDISGADVLSRFPKLRLSADLRDIDLGALTRRIDFGEITGIMHGEVENLELFRGVPVRFSARLETEHRKGVPRTVDVKAVKNITILGTGQRASVLDRGIQKFFDRYTYERLGVTFRLDRDVLLLRGLEQRAGKELFLRGRLPFRIDVVNAQPGKTVSFQTMVGRLRSLDFSAVTTEP